MSFIYPTNTKMESTILYLSGMVIGLAATIKAAHDIRTLGWAPFKTKWIPLRARALERRRMYESVELLTSQTFPELVEKVEKIWAEVTPNGGASLKDVVMRMQARAAAHDELYTSPIFELNGDGGMRSANAAFRDMLNAEMPELMYRAYVSRTHPNDRNRLLRDINDAVQNRMPLDTTVRFKVGSDDYIRVRLLAKPTVNANGVLIEYYGTAYEQK